MIHFQICLLFQHSVDWHWLNPFQSATILSGSYIFLLIFFLLSDSHSHWDEPGVVTRLSNFWCSRLQRTRHFCNLWAHKPNYSSDNDLTLRFACFAINMWFNLRRKSSNIKQFFLNSWSPVENFVKQNNAFPLQKMFWKLQETFRINNQEMKKSRSTLQKSIQKGSNLKSSELRLHNSYQKIFLVILNKAFTKFFDNNLMKACPLEKISIFENMHCSRVAWNQRLSSDPSFFSCAIIASGDVHVPISNRSG